MIGGKGVAASAVVAVISPILFKRVVSEVVQSLKRNSGSGMVSFGRMVEYDIQNYFDACFMQSLDHIAKFVDRT